MATGLFIVGEDGAIVFIVVFSGSGRGDESRLAAAADL
jgi:hypothetical protein